MVADGNGVAAGSLRLRVGGRYRDRQGSEVRIVCGTGHSTFPYRGSNTLMYTVQGKFYMGGGSHRLDLIEEIPEATEESSVPDTKPSLSQDSKDAIDLALLKEAISGARGDDQRAIAIEGVRLAALLIRKNADYGSSAWTRPSLAPECSPGVALRVRMSDKVSRLTNLLQEGKQELVTESIDETMRDLAGYIILELARPGR